MSEKQKALLNAAGITAALAAAAALLIGGISLLTADRIAARSKADTRSALLAVMPSAEYDFQLAELTDPALAAASAQGAMLTEAYRVNESGSQVGWAFNLTVVGTQGEIKMLVGVAADGTVNGVSVLSDTELSGAGIRLMENEDGFLDQFRGMSGGGSLAVGVNVRSLAGARSSSESVTRGVNAALAAAAVLNA